MKLSTQAWQQILNSIISNEYTNTHLDLSGLELTSVKVKQLASALEHSEHITSLDLSNNQIGDSGLKALGANTRLTHIDMSSNVIGDANKRAIMKAQAENQILIDLGLDPQPIESFSGLRALAENSHLISLNLSCNNLDVKAAEILGQNKTLEHLNIEGNFVGAQGAIFLAENTSLISLDISRNYIGLEGALALAHNATFSSLDISYNFRCNGAEVAEAFSHNTTLTSLNLAGNHIGNLGAQAIAKNTTLTHLDLSSDSYLGMPYTDWDSIVRYERIDVEGIKALANNTTLTQLMLSDNWLDNECAEILSQNSTLTQVDLKNNILINESWLTFFSDRLSNHSHISDTEQSHSPEPASNIALSDVLFDALSDEAQSASLFEHFDPVELSVIDMPKADFESLEIVSYSGLSCDILNTLGYLSTIIIE